MFDDVTPLRELALANQRLEAHMDNSPLAVIEFDPEFRVTRWSSEAQRVFGYSQDEIVGRSIGDMPLGLRRRTWGKSRRESESFVDGSVFFAEHEPEPRNYRSDGRVIWCEWYNSAIHDSRGRLVSVMSQVLDVTDRREAARLLDATGEIDRVIHSSLDSGRVAELAVAMAVKAVGAGVGLLRARARAVRHVASAGVPAPDAERETSGQWEAIARSALN